MEWLELFGDTRLPMHRIVYIGIGGVGCHLRRKEDETWEVNRAPCYLDPTKQKSAQRLQMVCLKVLTEEGGDMPLTREGLEEIVNRFKRVLMFEGRV